MQSGDMYPDPSRLVHSLVHLCGSADWQAARQSGSLSPDPGVGFVHLSTPEQVHLPANRLFAGRTDLLVLHIDPARLTAPLRWEPGLPGDPPTMRFPHLYGPLPVAAVVSVSPYRPQADGHFAALIHSDGDQRGQT